MDALYTNIFGLTNFPTLQIYGDSSFWPQLLQFFLDGLCSNFPESSDDQFVTYATSKLTDVVKLIFMI